MTLRLNRAGNDELKTYTLVHCWDEMPRYMEYLRHIMEGELLRKTVMMELAWISPPDRFSLVRMIP